MSLRVIIAGGGFGGLEAAYALKGLLKPSSEIMLIDRSAYHSFIPSIHLVVSGKVRAEEIRIPLGVVLGAAGARYIQEEIVSIETERREVITAGGAMQYDYLVLSPGAENNFFDIPGAEEFSHRFRTPEDAGRIRTKLLEVLDGPGPCRIVLAGAGTEGVEVAGEVIDSIRAEGREEELKSGRISIKMIEQKKRLLQGFPAEAQSRAEDYLRQRPVSLIAGDRIAEVRKNDLTLSSGDRHEFSILIWAGGIKPPKLIRELPLPKDPWGWLKVNDRLQVPGNERVYGVGDAVSIYTEDGPLALPRQAYHAEDQGRAAALGIRRCSEGKKPAAYRPKIRPRLVSLGGDSGILAADDRVYSGAWVVVLKKAVERTYLMTCLSKPVSAAVLSRIPGGGILYRMRNRLPV